MIRNGYSYIYRLDAQGNVVDILDFLGQAVVQYEYDAWGNYKILGDRDNIGDINPFKYRSYFYDVETGLYYLKSRYYDPEVGRFINQDSVDYAAPETINGLNLYAYCGNNPVMNVDYTGTNIADDFSTVLDILSVILKTTPNVITGMSKTFRNIGSAAKASVFGISNFFSGLTRGLSLLGNGLIVVSNIVDGVDTGKSGLNIFTDSVFDFAAFGLAGITGSAFTMIPLVGPVLGGVVGAGLSFAYSYFESSTFVQNLKNAFYNGVQTVVDDVTDIVVSVGNVITDSVSNLFEKIFRW